MNVSEATREVLWNISHAWIMYALLVPTVAIAGYGVYRRIKSWRRGQSAARFDQPLKRLKLLIQHGLLQQRTLRDRYAGLFHASIFWGMITLTAATTVVLIQHDFGLPIMYGRFYLYFQSLFVDLLGLAAIIGVSMAAARRWLARPKKLVYTDEASWILVIVFVILVTGFVLEGWRIAVTNDPWGSWSPVGYVVASVSSRIASLDSLRTIHVWTWWFHLLLVFGFIAWAPYTKMLHVLTSPLNIYTSNLNPPGGSLKTINFETSESFGINRLDRFTWKDLLDFDACTECGRCTAACPANRVGKTLSPRDIILDLRGLLHVETNGHTQPAEAKTDDSAAPPLIGATTALSPEALWECTSCGACVEACPVMIEQLPKIVDMRRFQVMEQAEFPDTLQEAVTSLEGRGHPFRGTRFSRVDWADGLDIPDIASTSDAEVLLWVGCGGALVERNQKITRAFAQLLKQAGVKFAILGRNEKCTGDPARRIGNEFLFETLAKDNVETLAGHNVKSIVTACPHCFNTFLNEYPHFGGQYEVFHHTTYLAKLIGEGRLKIDAETTRKITLHDPCYLSRHNHITEPPRELAQRATRNRLIEMTQSRRTSYCCGGGGGMSFIEEPPDKRVNQERARQILETDADTVAVACPFCTTMLEDGINAKKGDRKIEVKDIAELLWEAASSTRTNGA